MIVLSEFVYMVYGFDDVALNELFIFLTHAHQIGLYFPKNPLKFVIHFKYFMIQSAIFALQLIQSFPEGVTSAHIYILKILPIGLDRSHMAQGLLKGSQPFLKSLPLLQISILIAHELFEAGWQFSSVSWAPFQGVNPVLVLK